VEDHARDELRPSFGGNVTDGQGVNRL